MIYAFCGVHRWILKRCVKVQIILLWLLLWCPSRTIFTIEKTTSDIPSLSQRAGMRTSHTIYNMLICDTYRICCLFDLSLCVMRRNRLHPLNSGSRILSLLRGWKWAKRGAKILPSRLLTACLFVGFPAQDDG